MLALLPLAALALTFLALHGFSRSASAEPDRRRSFLSASVLWGVFLTASTEVLSLFHLFARLPVFLLWLLASASAGWVWLRRESRARGENQTPATQRVSGPGGARHQPSGGRLSSGGFPLLAAMASLLLLIGATAWLSAPNSWDSMTYHLPRVSHWIENRSVAHYPTHILRQLFLSPWSEFAFAHLEILSGSDRLANLVQWFAMLGSAIGVSLIARDLGGGVQAQIAAAAVALSLPMGVLQGSSSQNDYVAGFWLLCFISYLVALAREEGYRPLTNLLGAAASLGLACLTKGTAYIYALPYVLFFGILLVLHRRRHFWRATFLLGAVALSLNAGHFVRNVRVFGSPIGPPAGLFNEDLSLRGLLSNVSRNAALQLAAPSEAWNRFLEEVVERLHAALGADLNDPRTTWRGSGFHVPGVSPGGTAADSEETLYLLFHESYAANPFHFLILLAALGWIIAGSRRKQKTLLLYALPATAAFLLFCATLKWQPWHPRLHLPLFLIGSPAIALFLSAQPRLGGWVCAFLVIAAFPWALVNATRPLLGPESVLRTSRLEQYFQNRPDLSPLLLAAGRAIPRAPCPIGLELSPDDGEYLVRIALKAAGQQERALPHVSVRNGSRALAGKELSPPCAVLTLTSGGPERGAVYVSRSGTVPRIVVAQ